MLLGQKMLEGTIRIIGKLTHTQPNPLSVGITLPSSDTVDWCAMNDEDRQYPIHREDERNQNVSQTADRAIVLTNAHTSMLRNTNVNHSQVGLTTDEPNHNSTTTGTWPPTTLVDRALSDYITVRRMQIRRSIQTQYASQGTISSLFAIICDPYLPCCACTGTHCFSH